MHMELLRFLFDELLLNSLSLYDSVQKEIKNGTIASTKVFLPTCE